MAVLEATSVMVDANNDNSNMMANGGKVTITANLRPSQCERPETLDASDIA